MYPYKPLVKCSATTLIVRTAPVVINYYRRNNVNINKYAYGTR